MRVRSTGPGSLPSTYILLRVPGKGDGGAQGVKYEHRVCIALTFVEPSLHKKQYVSLTVR